MPQLQPTGPFPIDGAKMPTWIIRFDERGQCTSPATARALLDHLATEPYSDILLFSHGWNTDFTGAVALYRAFLAAFETVRAAHPVAGFNPIFVGITWPSAWFAEDPGPKLESAAVAAADVEGKVLAEVAAPLADPDRQRLYELAGAGVLSREQALDLVALLLPTIGATDDEVDTAELDAEALLAGAKQLGALSGGASNFDPATGLPDAEVMGGDGGFDPRDIIRMLSLFQMKDRSGAVGARGVSILLRQLLGASAAKVRLLGHSFGCKVMLSAVCVGAPLSRPVASMLLMQPALSHLAMALSVPGRNGPGGYRSALAPDRVSGQIFTTYSAKDMPLHDVFHLALRRRQDLGEAEIAAAGEPPSRYAAMGGYGPRGAGERLLSPIPAPGEAFGDLTGIKLVALDGSADRINGHGDITTGFTAWALHRLILE